jgi:pimeloyl-ACP methyl ester carboxylesterase
MNHQQFARDIIALCQARGIAQAVFCGESSGAMLLLALGVAAPDRVRALVLAGCTYTSGEKFRSWLRSQTPESVARELELTYDIYLDIGELKTMHTALGPEHWRTVLEAFIAHGTHAHAADFPEPQELRALQAPVLIVHGDRDSLFPLEVPTTLYGLLPNAELCVLPNTGHFPPWERPAWFNTIVLDFLSRRT